MHKRYRGNHGPVFAAISGCMSAVSARWGRAESNRRRQPFQGCALPTELPPHFRTYKQRRLGNFWVN